MEGVYDNNLWRSLTQLAPFFYGKELVGTFIFKSVMTLCVVSSKGNVLTHFFVPTKKVNSTTYC